jgi:hypothetical protein
LTPGFGWLAARATTRFHNPSRLTERYIPGSRYRALAWRTATLTWGNVMSKLSVERAGDSFKYTFVKYRFCR